MPGTTAWRWSLPVAVGRRPRVWLGALAMATLGACGGDLLPERTLGARGKADGQGPGDPRLTTEHSTADFLLGAIATGSLPKGAEISPDGRWLYTANMGRATVTAIDLEALSRWRANNPAVIFASDETTARALRRWLRDLSGTRQDDRVRTLDDPQVSRTIGTPYGYKGAVVGNIEVVFDDDGRHAFTTELERQVLRGRGQVTVIDVERQRVVAEIPSHGRGSKVMAVAPRPDAAGRRVMYVSNWFSSDISVLEIAGEMFEEELTAYASGRLSDRLHVKQIGLPTRYPSASQPFAVAPRGLAFTRDGRHALATGFNSRTLFVIDAQQHRQLAELPPLPPSVGGPSSMRHVVLTADDTVAYLALMRSDRVIRLDLPVLLQIVEEVHAGATEHLDGWVRRSDARGEMAMLRPSVWDAVLLPWADGALSLRVDRFGEEHTRPRSYRGRRSSRADPNTVVLDPRAGGRYLYVSCRNTKGWPPRDGRYDWDGKIDVVDTVAGRVIFTLVGGPEPTGLTISPDGALLASTDFRGAAVRLFDVGSLTAVYESLAD